VSFLSTPEFKVGLLVVVVSLLIGLMSLKVSENASYIGNSKKLYFLVDNAAGLLKNSPVRVAGIRVGVIDSIVLQEGRARVNMVVLSDVLLTESTRIEIRANGILGDKNVEIVPGSSNDPVLQDGGQILVVEDHASIDRLVSEVSKITGSLSDIVDNIRDATEGDKNKPLGKIVSNIEKLTTDLSSLVGNKKDEVANIIDRLDSVATTVDQMVSDDSDSGLQATWNRTLNRIESTMANVDDIASKINRGEGTIGKLVNDEETVEGINKAVTGINEFLSVGEKMETSFDYYSHYLTASQGVRNYFGIRIQPGLDRFYEIAIVDAPGGQIRRFSQTLTPEGGTPTTIDETKTDLDKTAITVLFGKNFYDFTIKGGIIESAGGIGLEYKFLRDRFRIQLDAFNLANPNVRGYMRYNFFRGLYVVGGQQYIFQDGNSNPSAFVGAGLFLTNDDIKLLLK